MSAENKAIARRFYEEIINHRNQSVVDELVAPGFVDHNPIGPGIAPGPEGVKQTFAMFRSGLPDMNVTIEDQIAEGDKVVSRLTARGTHKGELMGIPPTGKKLTMGVIDVIRFKGGKAVERWGESDNMGMMQQLGVIPTPEEA